MKFRIEKIPKTEKDLEEIEKEIQNSETEEHHHHHEEDLVTEILATLQLLQTKLEEENKEVEVCKREISRIYKILSKIVMATLTTDTNKKIKSLEEVAQILDE